MSTRLRSIATAALLAAVTFALYAVGIGNAPLTPAEIDVVQQAGSAGSLFFKTADERWLQPLAVYATSLASAVSAANGAGRVAAAAVGALNVALMFLLARRLLSSTAAGLGAALLLMATPAHIAFARTGVDAICPVPFVLAWLLALNAFFDSGSRRYAAAGAFALGLGVYSTPSGPLTMGFLLVATVGTVWLSGRKDAASLTAPVAGFAVPLGVALTWFVANPTAYPDTFGRWAIHAAHLRSPLDLAQALVNWNTLGTRASLYWGFFDPAWLFLDNPSDSSLPLRGTAPFLLATAAALVAGVRACTRTEAMPMTCLLFAGVAIAPLAASTFGAPHAIADALAMTPFIAILAAIGVAGWVRRSDGWQWLGYGVIAAMAGEAIWFAMS